MIDSKDISVVISGPVMDFVSNSGMSEVTKKACESVRQFLPEAEIVLSTWEGTDCRGLEYDKLVLSKDPGENISNINRQITSRIAGIRQTTREYVLAIRSESKIVNLDFISYLDKYNEYNEEYKYLKHRVVIPAACPPRCGELFHMGDWYYLGHREDMLILWDLPLMNDKEYNQSKDDILYHAHRWVITEFVRKFRTLNFYKKKDINTVNRELYINIMVNNFVIIGLYEFGCRSMKYILNKKFFTQMFHYYVSWTYAEWLKLYEERCCGTKVQALAENKVKRPLIEYFGIYIYSPLRRFATISGIEFCFVRIVSIAKKVRSMIFGNKKISNP